MTASAGLITWTAISFTYVRFYNAAKLQGIDRNTFPYKSPMQPYAAYYALVFTCVILFFQGWQVFVNINGNFNTADFVTSYLPLVIFPTLYYGYAFTKKTKMIALADIDFYSGTRDIDEEDDPAPTTIIGRLSRCC